MREFDPHHLPHLKEIEVKHLLPGVAMLGDVLDYECHVTTLPQFKSIVDPIAKQYGFSTSLLVGDDVVGTEKHLYCTTHGSEFIEVNNRVNKLVQDLTALKVTVKRKKIELTVLDERF